MGKKIKRFKIYEHRGRQGLIPTKWGFFNVRKYIVKGKPRYSMYVFDPLLVKLQLVIISNNTNELKSFLRKSIKDNSIYNLDDRITDITKKPLTPQQKKIRSILIEMKSEPNGEFSKKSIGKIGKLREHQLNNVIRKLTKQRLIYRFTGKFGTPVYQITKKGKIFLKG